MPLGLGTDRVDIEPRLATFDELATVHDASYLRELEAFCAGGGGRLDPDTFAGTDVVDRGAPGGRRRTRRGRRARRRQRVRWRS